MTRPGENHRRVIISERASADASSMDSNATTDARDNSSLNFEIRPTCVACDRLSVTFDARNRPLCARHATIFMLDHAALSARRQDTDPE